MVSEEVKASSLVAHFPTGAGNPYNELLGEAIELDGEFRVASIPNGFHTNPWRALRFARTYRLVHFHWLDGHYNGKTFLRFVFRALAFLGCLTLFRLRGTRMVLTVHNLVPHEHSYRALHKLVNIGVGRLMSRLIVHNPASVSRVSKEYWASGKVSVVEHIDYSPWVDKTIVSAGLQSSSEEGAGAKRKRVVFFGQLRPYKGIEVLLDAARLCDCDFLIVGRPFTPEYGRLLGERSEALPNVTIDARFVEDDELSAILLDSDVAVFPYGDTLCSGAAHYALAHDLPAVASATTAFQELIDIGLIVEWSNTSSVQALARAISEACALKKQDWLPMNRTYRQRCSAQEVGLKLRRVYKEALDEEDRG